MLKTKSVWSLINRKTDGLRILVTRIRGRDLPASRYDVWMANLGPSERLLHAGQRGKMSWAQFSGQYRRELFLDGPIDKRSLTVKNHGQKFHPAPGEATRATRPGDAPTPLRRGSAAVSQAAVSQARIAKAPSAVRCNDGRGTRKQVVLILL
jgi:uncharacterized protein YeaO (DUF488 family)